MLPKKPDNRLGNRAERREEKELTGAEYELPSEGAHTIFFVR